MFPATQTTNLFGASTSQPATGFGAQPTAFGSTFGTPATQVNTFGTPTQVHVTVGLLCLLFTSLVPFEVNKLKEIKTSIISKQILVIRIVCNLKTSLLLGCF